MTTPIRRRRALPRFWRAVVVGALVGLLVVLILEFTGLNPVHFSGQIRTFGGPPGPAPPSAGPFTQSIPRGPTVTVQWAVMGSAQVVFEVLPPGAGPSAAFTCYDRGSSGSCSFVSVGGSYTFQAIDTDSLPGSEVVNVAGLYLTPLL